MKGKVKQMRKKLTGLLLLAALTASQVMGVAAASKGTNITVAGDSVGAYNVQEITEAELSANVSDTAVADMILKLNAGTNTLSDLAETTPDIAAQLEGKTMISQFADITPLNGGIQTADGKYLVTLSVPGLTDATSDVLVLHYSTVRKVWETIEPEVNLADKEVTAVFEDLSPVAVIAKVDADKAVDNAQGTSPKTGMESGNWGVFAGAAVVLFGAAIVVAVRKKRA